MFLFFFRVFCVFRGRVFSTIIHTERVAQPVQPRRIGIAIGLDHVEAAGGIGECAMAGEEQLRRAHQLAAFVEIDRTGLTIHS